MSDEDSALLAKVRAIGPLRGYPTKLCQFCVQPIPLDARVCKFCTRDVNTEDEVTDLLRNYFKKMVKQNAKFQRNRMIIIGFIIVFAIIIMSVR